MQKDELMGLIRGKSRESLLRPDQPEQDYFFWLIMERFCNQNGVSARAELLRSPSPPELLKEEMSVI